MEFPEELSIRPKHQPPALVKEKGSGAYGTHDTLRYGFASARGELIPCHPLEHAQANFELNREALMFQTLRDTQGLHAPLRLQMERKIVSRIQRLPPLESSMVALETLTGNDECLGIEEVLNPPTDTPVMVNGRAATEKKLKMT